MEYLRLNNGIDIPQVGLGTFLIPEDKLDKTLLMAYDMGYRHFDTAWKYHNETQIARAFKAAGIKREDLFITTKVNADALYRSGYKNGLHKYINFKCKSIEKAIEESFSNLETDYIDLFLIHYPWPMYRKMWKALEKLYKDGRIRAIGVSNMLQPHIEAIKEISDVLPMVNQFEISPLNTQKELIKYCQDNDIVVEAMSTFSHFRSVEPRNEIIKEPKLIKIATKYNKSVVQIVLRWLAQQNILLIPKTWNEKHLLENISIFDFELDNEDIEIIDSLDKGKFLNYNPYLATEGLPSKYKKWYGFHDKNNLPDWYLSMPKWRQWIY